MKTFILEENIYKHMPSKNWFFRLFGLFREKIIWYPAGLKFKYNNESETYIGIDISMVITKEYVEDGYIKFKEIKWNP